MILLVFTGVTSLSSGLQVLRFQNFGFSVVSDTYTYLSSICEAVILFLPLISSLLCIIFSKLYLEVISNVFKCVCILNLKKFFKLNIIHANNVIIANRKTCFDI